MAEEKKVEMDFGDIHVSSDKVQDALDLLQAGTHDSKEFESMLLDEDPFIDIRRLDGYIGKVTTKSMLVSLLQQYAQMKGGNGLGRSSKNMIMAIKYANMADDLKAAIRKKVDARDQVAPEGVGTRTYRNYLDYLGSRRFNVNVSYLSQLIAKCK